MHNTQFKKIIKSELAKLRTLAVPQGARHIYNAYNYSSSNDTGRRKQLLEQVQKQKGLFSFARSS